MRIFAFFIIIILLLLSLLICHLSLRRPEMVNSLELGERSGPEAILSLPVLAGPLRQRGARASFPKVWESVIYKPNFSFFRVIQHNLKKLDTRYCVRTRNTKCYFKELWLQKQCVLWQKQCVLWHLWPVSTGYLSLPARGLDLGYIQGHILPFLTPPWYPEQTLISNAHLPVRKLIKRLAQGHTATSWEGEG